MGTRLHNAALGAAVILVLALVVHELQRAPEAHGRRAAAARAHIEQLMRRGEWAVATEPIHLILRRDYAERRAHLMLSRCVLERGLPDLAVQHLALAAVPVQERLLFAPPRPDEIEALLRRFELLDGWARHPAHYARLSRVARWAAAPLAISASENAFSGQTPPSADLTNLMRSTMADLLAAGAGADLLSETIDALTAEALVALPTRALDKPLLVAAGGLCTGYQSAIVYGEQAIFLDERTDCVAVVLDATNGRSVHQASISLSRNAADADRLLQMAVSMSREHMLVMLFSAEGLYLALTEARKALADGFRLDNMPARDEYLCYAVLVAPAFADDGAVEIVAMARDLPALGYWEASPPHD